MTPKRYLVFGALTVAIQTGVIASQPAMPLLSSLSESTQMTAFKEANKAVTLSFATHSAAEKSAAISAIKNTPANTITEDAISTNVPNTSKPQTAPTLTDTPVTEIARQAPKPTKAKPQTIQSAVQNKPTPNTSSKAGATTAKPLMAANTQHQKETGEITKPSDQLLSQMAESNTQDKTVINNTNVTPTSVSENTKATPEVIELATPTFASKPPQPTYPRMARKKGLEGTATVEVMFNEFGQQLALTLVKSSGVGLLDQAALEIGRAHV